MKRIFNTSDLGKIIREERKRQNVSQADLAAWCNVGVTYLSKLENGKESSEIGKALNIMAILGLDIFVERRGE